MFSLGQGAKETLVKDTLDAFDGDTTDLADFAVKLANRKK